MIKSFFKVILVIIVMGFLSISPKSRYLIGNSLKYLSQILLWTVNIEDNDKWIKDRPNWFQI